MRLLQPKLSSNLVEAHQASRDHQAATLTPPLQVVHIAQLALHTVLSVASRREVRGQSKVASFQPVINKRCVPLDRSQTSTSVKRASLQLQGRVLLAYIQKAAQALSGRSLSS